MSKEGVGGQKKAKIFVNVVCERLLTMDNFDKSLGLLNSFSGINLTKPKAVRGLSQITFAFFGVF